MPTAMDRIQVLLKPDEYAEISLLASEERRSLASMAAVLINEAIKARIREGSFTPQEDDPAYANAKRRQVARSLGQKVSKESFDVKGLADELGVQVELISKKVDRALSLERAPQELD
jgi:hypothetical protein